MVKFSFRKNGGSQKGDELQVPPAQKLVNRILTSDPRTFSSSFMSMVVRRADHAGFARILDEAHLDPSRKSWVKEAVQNMCDAPGLHKIDRDHRVVKFAFSEIARHVKDAELKAHIEKIVSRHREMRLDLAGFEGQMPYY